MARLLMMKREHPDFEVGMIVDILDDTTYWKPRRNYQPINIPGADKSLFLEWLEPKFEGPPEDPQQTIVAMRKWKVDVDTWGVNDENYVENIANPVADRIQRLMDHKLDV